MHSAADRALSCPSRPRTDGRAAADRGPVPATGPTPSSRRARPTSPAPMHPDPLRPRDLALLLLASPDLRPRQRARDQQADRAGLNLLRRVLEEVAARDPEPAELD